MKLIITNSIKNSEFLPLEEVFDLEVIKLAAKQALLGLGKKIKSSLKIKSTALKKVKLTSPSGAGRALFLLQISEKKSVLVMLRLKNDKKIGENMSVQNPKFKKVLEKNLLSIIEEIENGDYEEFEL